MPPAKVDALAGWWMSWPHCGARAEPMPSLHTHCANCRSPQDSVAASSEPAAGVRGRGVRIDRGQTARACHIPSRSAPPEGRALASSTRRRLLCQRRPRTSRTCRCNNRSSGSIRQDRRRRPAHEQTSRSLRRKPGPTRTRRTASRCNRRCFGKRPENIPSLPRRQSLSQSSAPVVHRSRCRSRCLPRIRRRDRH